MKSIYKFMKIQVLIAAVIASFILGTDTHIYTGKS